MNTTISFSFLLNGKKYQHGKFITGNELRQIGSIDADSKLFLKVEGIDEEVHDTEAIDLARIGIESFYSVKNNPTFKFTLDKKEFTWEKFITEQDLRKVGNLDDKTVIYLEVEGADEVISKTSRIDLARFGIEHFYTKPKHPPHVLIHFFIDKKEFKTSESVLTARDILIKFGGIEPDQVNNGSKTLVLVETGFEYVDPDTEITMKDCMEFTIYDNTPCTVS